jgi:hypothetical protein
LEKVRKVDVLFYSFCSVIKLKCLKNEVTSLFRPVGRNARSRQRPILDLRSIGRWKGFSIGDTEITDFRNAQGVWQCHRLSSLQVKAFGLFPSSLSSGTNQRITSKHTKENVPSEITVLLLTNTLYNGRLSKHPKQLFFFVFVL